MVEDLIVKEVQRYTLRALKQAKEGLTKEAIIRKVELVVKKKYGKKCSFVPKLIVTALAFFKRNGFIIFNESERYMLQDRFLNYANKLCSNEEPHTESMEAIYKIRKNCHLTTQEKRSRELNPNLPVKCTSENSLSGDQIERTRKMMRSNNKSIRVNPMPTDLGHAHKLAVTLANAENEHICFLPENGLRDFETLTVLHPQSYEFCGRMVFLPTKLQNPKYSSELNAYQLKSKVHTATQVDNVEKFNYSESYTGIEDPNRDELRPPIYVNSCKYSKENIKIASRNILKRKKP